MGNRVGVGEAGAVPLDVLCPFSYGPVMPQAPLLPFTDLPRTDLEALPDAEALAILRAALQSGGGQLTRMAECHLAGIAASAVLDRLAVSGVVVARKVDRGGER